MTDWRKIFIYVFILTSCFQGQGADKYTDENRPYEFGFSIDGEQHRHEKKDENGIIMGEFGFITADGVYHVTVYATDENGNFKILSMKNIRVKPYPTSSSSSGNDARKGHSLSLPSSPNQTPSTFTKSDTAKPVSEKPKLVLNEPARSCSHCSLPTTTPRVVYSPINSDTIATDSQGGNNPQSTGSFTPTNPNANEGNSINSNNQPYQPQVNPGGIANTQNNLQSDAQFANPQNNLQSNAQFANPQNNFQNNRNSVPSHPSPFGNNNEDYNNQVSPSGANQPQSLGNGPNYYQNSLNPPTQISSQPIYNNNNNNEYTGNDLIKSRLGEVSSSYPNNERVNPYSNINDNSKDQNVPQNPNTYQGSLDSNAPGDRNPKQLNVNQQLGAGQNAGLNAGADLNGAAGFPGKPEKPVLISAQMQVVDKNTDIYHKNPGEKDGLPKGLTKSDMESLLYTFNYTVGFHGHYEEGYTSGAKQGYYYVTGRNGVRTRVDYVADENGFRPKITQEVLDLLSEDVPKPETEKDEKYGLKGYEFKWLYFPVESNQR